MDAQHFRGVIGTTAIEQIDDDEIAGPQTRIATAPQMAPQPLLDTEADFRHNRTHGNSLPGAGAPVNTLLVGIPIFFHTNRFRQDQKVAAESRTVI